jgi:hypothetical protein
MHRYACLYRLQGTSSHREWCQRVSDEFFLLGDQEKALGLSPSPLCDRALDNDVAKNQIAFFKFVCVPLVLCSCLAHMRLHSHMCLIAHTGSCPSLALACVYTHVNICACRVVPFFAVIADLIEPNMLPWLRVQANLQHWTLTAHTTNGGSFRNSFRAGGHEPLFRSHTVTLATRSGMLKKAQKDQGWGRGRGRNRATPKSTACSGEHHVHALVHVRMHMHAPMRRP